jgi:hypothetical protein
VRPETERGFVVEGEFLWLVGTHRDSWCRDPLRRTVLKGLLGDERLRVRPDEERGFAGEGEFLWLVGSGSEPCSGSVVAGIRSATGERHHMFLRWSWAA